MNTGIMESSSETGNNVPAPDQPVAGIISLEDSSDDELPEVAVSEWGSDESDKDKDKRTKKIASPSLGKGKTRDLGGPEANGSLPDGTTMEQFYTRRGQLAVFLGWSAQEFDEFLVEDEEVKIIHQQYYDNVLKPSREAAKESGKGFRARDLGFEKLLEMVDSEDAKKRQRFSNPRVSDQKDWSAEDWICRTLWLYKSELERAGIFHKKKLSNENIWRWAYMVMKCKENVESTDRKRTQAMNALKNRRQAARERARKQKEKTQTQRAHAAVHGDGTIVAPRVPRRKPSSRGAKRKSRSSKASSGAPGSDSEDGPPVIRGLSKRVDTYLKQLQKEETKLQHQQKSTAGDTLDVEDASNEQIFEHMQKTMKEEDVKKGLSARRDRMRKKALRDAAHCFNELKKNRSARHCYRRLLKSVRAATEDFFVDFRCVDAKQYSELCLSGMKLQLTQEDVASNVFTERSEKQLVESMEGNTGGKEEKTVLQGRDSVSKDGVLENLQGQEAATVMRQMHAAKTKNTDSVEDEKFDTYNIDLPPPSDAAIRASVSWSNMINSADFQRDDLKSALQRCFIQDARFLRLPHQNKDKSLRWWQLICIQWAADAHAANLTKGGIIADAIGLGKTIEFAGIILLDMIEQIDARKLGETGDCKPWMIHTLPSLVSQTSDALRDFSNFFHIVVLHGESEMTDTPHLKVDAKLPNNHEVWNKSLEKNIRTIIVTSANTLNSQHGPGGQIRRAKELDPMYREPVDGIPKLDGKWEDNPHGRVRGMIVDECQATVRNESFFWATVKWFDAQRLYLFSGSPSPRGLQDFSSYLGLLEHPSLADEAKQCEKTDETFNPYDVPHDHEYVKYRYTKYCFDKFIVDNEDMDDVEKGVKAQMLLRNIILRRDYNSACPIGSDHTIGKNLPPLRHFSIERLFCPSAQELFEQCQRQWARRMVIINEKNGLPIPNPRATRAMNLLTFCPLLGWLHKSNPKYNPPNSEDENEGPDEETLKRKKRRRTSLKHVKKTEENDPDWCSWFNDNSMLYKDMPKIGSNYRRWRWILKTIVSLGCKEIPAKDYIDVRKVPNDEILSIVLKFSPKLQALMSSLAEHSVLRDEKTIVWFSYPITQELVHELIMGDEHLREVTRTLNSSTSNKTRANIQSEMNEFGSGSKIRVLLASMRVGGVGLNFQNDSYIGILFETPESIDYELQVIGRQYRLGQHAPVTIYSLHISGTLDDSILEKLINRSLQGTASLMSHSNPNDPSESQDNEDNSAFSQYLHGFFPYQVEGVQTAMHISSKEGQQALAEIRQRDGMANDWTIAETDFLPPQEALRMLIKHHRAIDVIQHGGIGKTSTQKLDFLVDQELEERREHAEKNKDNDEKQHGESSEGATEKSVARAPQADGIIYPSQMEYDSMPTKDKTKATRSINKQRTESGRSKWEGADRWHEDGSPNIGPWSKKRKSDMEQEDAIEKRRKDEKNNGEPEVAAEGQ